MTRAVRPRTLRRIASRERQRGYLGLNSYRRLAASARSGPVFFSQLTTSLVPDKAAPGTAPTFTRATTKTFTDWEGVVRTALAGEACFTGARRVRNVLPTTSEDFTNAQWTKTTLTVTPGAIDPSGGTSAYTLTANGASSAISSAAIGATASGNACRGSIWIRRRAGVGTVNARSGGTTDVDITAAVGGTWQRLAWNGTAIDTALRFQLTLITSGDAVDVWHAMSEDVTGQSNQNPSEYVSVGVLSAPYQGANFDGVQYFATQNGNTVANNVVTAATGAAIASSVLLGYSAWQQSTNLVLQSENFGTTWVAVGTPTRSAAALRCGDVVLDLLSDADAGTLDGYTQTVTFTGDAVKAVSIHFAQGSATTSLVQLQDSTATATRLSAVITWSGGVPTVTVGTGALLGVDSLGNGIYRMRVATASLFAANTNVLKVFPASDAIGTVSLVGNAYFGGVQAENLVFATPYIATTTAAVTRSADSLTYPATGNVLGTAGSTYAEATWSVTNGGVIDLDSAGNRPAPFLSGAVLSMFDGTTSTTASPTLTTPSSAPQKLAASWGAAVEKTFLNGTAGAGAVFDGDMNVGTNLLLGARGSGGGGPALNGTIRNVKIWNRALADAELVQATS